MWLAFQTLANNEPPTINGGDICFAYFFDGWAVTHPVGAPALQK